MEGSDEVYDARWPLVLMVVLTLMGAVLVAAVLLHDRSPAAPGAADSADATPRQTSGQESSRPSSPAVAPNSEGVAVLRAWDRARSRAWARGDLDSLRALYADGSKAGAQDVAMLRSWTERGLRVTGMRMQVLAVREIRRTDSEWVLRVTDRVIGGVAVGDNERISLPVDAASTRVIRWQRGQDAWRVAAVQEVV